jgi:hypothetical protein
LRTFLGARAETVRGIVVLVGTEGPCQKSTVQLLGQGRDVLGYVKYAVRPRAQKRLAAEYDLLRELPAAVGPRALSFGRVADGSALLLTPVPGARIRARLPVPVGVRSFLESLIVSDAVPLEEHPWVVRARQLEGMDGPRWTARLRSRRWPIVIQHGDLAPWNALKGSGGNLLFVDWEYGVSRSLPFLDLAYYVMQVGALVYRWKPERALRYAVDHLAAAPWPGLQRDEAEAVVRLSILDAQEKARFDGEGSTSYLARWRRSVVSLPPITRDRHS